MKNSFIMLHIHTRSFRDDFFNFNRESRTYFPTIFVHYNFQDVVCEKTSSSQDRKIIKIMHFVRLFKYISLSFFTLSNDGSICPSNSAHFRRHYHTNVIQTFHILTIAVVAPHFSYCCDVN